MKSFAKVFLPIALIIVAVGVGLKILQMSGGLKRGSQDGRDHFHATVGVTAPNFELMKFPTDASFRGKVKLSSLGKKVILINFWASWCSACLIEMPSIMKLRAKYLDQGFDVVALNVDEDPSSVVPKMISGHKIDLPIFIDEGQRLSELFQVSAIPFNVIIDKNLKILFMEAGERDWNSSDVHTQVEQWLRK